MRQKLAGVEKKRRGWVFQGRGGGHLAEICGVRAAPGGRKLLCRPVRRARGWVWSGACRSAGASRVLTPAQSCPVPLAAASDLRGKHRGGPHVRAVGARAARRAGQDLHVGFRRGQGGCRAKGAAACRLSASRCGVAAALRRQDERVVPSRAGGDQSWGGAQSCSGIQAATSRNGCPNRPAPRPRLMPSAASRPASRAAHNASTVRTRRLRAGDAGCAALALRVGASEEKHAEVADDAGHQANADHPAAGVQIACGGVGSGGWGASGAVGLMFCGLASTVMRPLAQKARKNSCGNPLSVSNFQSEEIQ